MDIRKLWEKSLLSDLRRSMLKSPIIYIGLSKELSFSSVESKYVWNCSGELCCRYITPQIMFLQCRKSISIHKAWKASLDVFFKNGII